MNTILIQTIIVLLFSALFSGLEIAFVSSNKLRFEMDREEQGLSARIIDIFYRHPNHFISTMLVGNNIALVIYGILMAQLIDGLLLEPIGLYPSGKDGAGEVARLLIQTGLSTLIVLVTGEFLPKTLFRLNPNRMLRIFSLPAFLVYIILWPISKFASALSKSILFVFGMKVKKQDHEKIFTKIDLDHLIQSNIDDIEDEEKIENEVKIFQNALDFSSVKVRDCIVPRTEVEAVDDQTSLNELRNQFVETGHSKIMVFHEDIDNIKGYIHSSEMFRLQAGEDWTKYIREAPFVPETMNAQKLMHALISQKKSLAVVVDEFGGTSGIVTLEDLVEEIFGDIEDEHDNVNYTAKQLDNGEYLLSARLEISKANEILGLDLPESDEYLTVGGLILHEYQSFPKLNEIVKFGQWEFKIIEKTTTKIELVRLKVLV